jgi:hypothetical protein
LPQQLEELRIGLEGDHAAFRVQLSKEDARKPDIGAPVDDVWLLRVGLKRVDPTAKDLPITIDKTGGITEG